MKKGFTLIELLIVIGILVILAAVVVLVLNPAQMLAQARDSQRLSDMTTLKSSISLYLATATSTSAGLDVNFLGDGTDGYISNTLTIVCPFSNSLCTTVTSTAVNGTGWLSVPLTLTTGGSPVSILPLDPSNTAAYYYSYAGNDVENTFEIDMVLESTRYKPLMTTDGGDKDLYYEVGTDPGLNL